MANTVDLDNITEYRDDSASTMAKCAQLVDILRSARHAILFTGAGISTSAKIPDFRGPNGVWTRQAQGKDGPECISLRQAVPTPCHRVIAAMVGRNIVQHVVSQNIDGLHRRSGVERARLSELHGNCFLRVCWKCGYDEETDAEVDSGLRHSDDVVHEGNRDSHCGQCRLKVPHFCHCTARLCPRCNTEAALLASEQPLRASGARPRRGHQPTTAVVRMRDSIIHFGENLPEHDLAEAFRHAELADVCVVLGSSCTVSPANEVPKRVAKRGGKLVIVNLQKTDLDARAALRLFATSDDVAAFLDRAFVQPFDAPPTRGSLALPNQPTMLGGTPFPPSAAAASRRPEESALAFHVGNTHRLSKPAAEDEPNSASWHEWELFVKPCNAASRERVQQLTITLHPTFNPSQVNFGGASLISWADGVRAVVEGDGWRESAGGYFVRRSGWGTFNVGVELRHAGRDGGIPSVATTAHQLDFSCPETAQLWQVTE